MLCANDKMTAQANDTNAKSWVLEDQHRLQKKGVGCGIHKVTSSAQQLVGSRQQAKALSMEKITRDIGLVNCLQNRKVIF